MHLLVCGPDGSYTLPRIGQRREDRSDEEFISSFATDSGQAYALSKRAALELVERRAGRWGSAGARLASPAPGVIETNMGSDALRDPEIGARVRHLVHPKP